jgi:hypothetical protein
MYGAAEQRDPENSEGEYGFHGLTPDRVTDEKRQKHGEDSPSKDDAEADHQNVLHFPSCARLAWLLCDGSMPMTFNNS